MLDDRRATGHSPHAVFGERGKLLNIAFRMLGSTPDADEVVQDTYARWFALSDEERRAVRSPATWLMRTAGRTCLDHLAAARTRREQYVGEWLPEPLPGDTRWNSSARTEWICDPAEHVTFDESVSMGVMVVLESVTPAERIAFILHDVYDLPHTEIACVIGRVPPACCQLAASARRHIQERRHRPVAPEQHRDVVAALRQACADDDHDALADLLDPEVSVRSDGGGKVRAALRPVHGQEKAARFLLGLLRPQHGQRLAEETVSGHPGLAAYVDGEVVAVVATDVRDGRVCDLWMILNPDKLHAWRCLQPARCEQGDG